MEENGIFFHSNLESDFIYYIGSQQDLYKVDVKKCQQVLERSYKVTLKVSDVWS